LIDGLALDRMAIEEVGPNPERLAAAIHDQLQHKSGEVPIEAIATALDIIEIRKARLQSFEGALLAPDDRNVGAILLNSESSPVRRRFTLAYELGHFLNSWHGLQNLSRGFACSRMDIAIPWRKPSSSASRHAVQEAEANRFAIDLLAPRWLMRPYLRGIPDLAAVLRLSKELGLSREAGGRRYVELHEQPCSAPRVWFATSSGIPPFRLCPVDMASDYPHCQPRSMRRAYLPTRKSILVTGLFGPTATL
jgi:Zn-dependent peptidase ImmA (M78 family)